jgi:hypothetical protein
MCACMMCTFMYVLYIIHTYAHGCKHMPHKCVPVTAYTEYTQYIRMYDPCMYVYIYKCVCVYIYIYIYNNSCRILAIHLPLYDWPLIVRKQSYYAYLTILKKKPILLCIFDNSQEDLTFWRRNRSYYPCLTIHKKKSILLCMFDHSQDETDLPMHVWPFTRINWSHSACLTTRKTSARDFGAKRNRWIMVYVPVLACWICDRESRISGRESGASQTHTFPVT